MCYNRAGRTASGSEVDFLRNFIMGLPETAREVFVCELVAEAINVSEGTDYRAHPYKSDPPDVLLVSETGRYATRQVEVVSTPQDPAIRYDNKNKRHFEHTLRIALERLGVAECQVTVNWTEAAMRYGTQDRRIVQFARIIAHRLPADGHLSIRGVELYDCSPEISEIVNYVSMFRLQGMTLSVNSACSWWAPRDGQWIEAALAKKLKRYGGREISSLTLVIDGLAHLDAEQMSSFRANNKLNEIPFAELWAVTMGKAYRLKP